MLAQLSVYLSKIISLRFFAPLAAALIGLFFFLFIYGVAVLNPTNVDWLLAGGDLSQHFIGWQFYRLSDWTFPLGVASNLAYPHGLAITFMDSIPLLAIPFKFIAPLLPSDFQYFGIWGLTCFMLQGTFAALIVRHWTKNITVILLASIIFILSPIMLGRMFIHTALAGHWIILLGILLLIKSTAIRTNKLFILAWSTTLSLSVMIHPYFFAMNAALLLMGIVLRYDTLKRALITFFIPLFSAGFIFWCIGGFTIKTVGAGGLGDYGLNLNSLTNPLGWSGLLGNLPYGKAGGESLAYLGLGVLIAGVVAAMYLLFKCKDKPFRAKVMQLLHSRYLLIFIILLGLFILSVSTHVQLGSVTLLEYHLPQAIEKLLSVFRASARLFWPIYYLLMVAIIVVCIRMFDKKNKLIVVSFFALVVSVQAVDVLRSGAAQASHSHFQQVSTIHYYNKLSGVFWSDAAKDKKHIIYLGNLYNEDFKEVAEFAIKHNLTLNTGYFARAPTTAIEATIESAKNDLLIGKPSADTLYITKDKYVVDELSVHDMYSSSLQNGFYVISSS